MAYVDHPTPATVPCWYDEDENGLGYYCTQYSPPRSVLDAWRRSPAQAAAAESRAKVEASRDAHMAELAYIGALGQAKADLDAKYASDAYHAESRARCEFLLQSSRPRFPYPYGVAA